MKNNIQDISKGITIFLLVVGLTYFTSCSDFLDEKPYSSITDKDVPDSDKGADMWVMGAYSGLSKMFTWSEFPRVIELDNDYFSGPTYAFGEVGAGNFQGNEQANSLWNRVYELIDKTNVSISHIEQMKNVDVRKKENNLGELYFLQAYGYFLLVRAYGAIPIYEKSVNEGTNVHQPRQPIPIVYDHIIKLLTDAKDMIYKNTDSKFEEGRVCAGAAASLLAKVYATIGSASVPAGEVVTIRAGKPFILNQDGSRTFTFPTPQVISKIVVPGYESFSSKEYYQKALDIADEVINKKLYGNHELIDYDILWKKAGKNSKEHFFALQTKSGDEYYGAAFVIPYCGRWSGNMNTGYLLDGNGLTWGMRDHWYKLFENKDYRIEKGVIHRWVRQWSLGWNGGNYYPNTEEWKIKATGKDNDGNIVGTPVAPFNDGRSYSTDGSGEYSLAYLNKFADVTDITITRMDALYPLLRYADVVLIFAEASNEIKGVNSDALKALNDIRKRSNATEKTLSDFKTKADFRSAVIEERAMELAGEADRRWDLIRWGIYVKAMNSVGGVDECNVNKVREQKHIFYPLPQDEVLTNNAITENNPGWN